MTSLLERLPLLGETFALVMAPVGAALALSLHGRHRGPAGASPRTSNMNVPFMLQSIILAGAQFRVGSGAEIEPQAKGFLVEASWPKLGAVDINSSSVGAHQQVTRLTYLATFLAAIALLNIVAHMVPAGGVGRDNFNYRIPPSWSPD